MRVPRFFIYAGFAVVLAYVVVNVWRWAFGGEPLNW